MDQNITKRPIPLPYPESPSVESWRAAHGEPQQPQDQQQSQEDAQ